MHTQLLYVFTNSTYHRAIICSAKKPNNERMENPQRNVETSIGIYNNGAIARLSWKQKYKTQLSILDSPTWEVIESTVILQHST